MKTPFYMWQDMESCVHLHTSLHNRCNLHGTKHSHESILYNIYKNDYLHEKSHYSFTGKLIVANYVIVSVTLYFASIEKPNKIDGKHAANSWREAPLSQFGITEHCIIFMHYLTPTICNINVCILLHIAINSGILALILNKILV